MKTRQPPLTQKECTAYVRSGGREDEVGLGGDNVLTIGP
jgi:hypothetical protein